VLANNNRHSMKADSRARDHDASDAISFDMYVKMFRQFELAISRNTVRPDFDRIEGRAVAGGGIAGSSPIARQLAHK